MAIDRLAAYCKRRGFVYCSSEIYGGLGAIYDYGPLGALLKRHIRERWFKSMTWKYQNIVELDSAIFMHPKIWEASGHVQSFHDPMIDDKQTKRRYRADLLIEQWIESLNSKGKKSQALAIKADLKNAKKGDYCENLYKIITEQQIPSPGSGSFNWTKVRQFNLMFKTDYYAVENQSYKIYLRPETAQGIYVNYRHVMDSMNLSIPFGIAQIGKAFRNEVIARRFIFRMREFEQMELQFFCSPKESNDYFERWKNQRKSWIEGLGIPHSKLRIVSHSSNELPHYAQAAIDFEYQFAFGWKEIEGVHHRGSFDLTQHQNYSGKRLEYFNSQTQERAIPHVIETSAGLDRMVLMLLDNALTVDKVNNQERTLLKIQPSLAPISLGIFPLIKNASLVELAQKIKQDFYLKYRLFYSEKGSIGKRYRHMDEIGTPYCLTIDFDTINDHSVTIRERDTMNQHRVTLSSLSEWLDNSFKNNL